MKQFNLRRLTLMAVLMALQLVLGSMFSIQFLLTKISFGFIPMAICAYLFGPWVTANISGLSYLLGMLLFPKFAFFLGFAVTAWLSGFVFGYFLHRKLNLWRITAATAIVTFILNLFLNSLWLHMMYTTSWPALFATRVPQEIVTLIIYVAVLWVLNRKYFTDRLASLAQVQI
ncbi:MAG: folate family ECF transporter S component [Lactobacillus sp.]|nr:folate family ECF transporter S component [Lactobacillus sp.]